AQYIVTQLFFDNKKFFAFRDRCWQEGIRVPIIPGIKPIERLSHLTFMPKFFHVEIPGPLTHALMQCKSDEEARQVGVDWGIAQCKELLENDVPGIHFFTMGKSKAVRAIAGAIFSDR
ncbi:MAG: methylenetetrahydrofolate reductase, partial [Flavobacteriales bacterium]